MRKKRLHRRSHSAEPRRAGRYGVLYGALEPACCPYVRSKATFGRHLGELCHIGLVKRTQLSPRRVAYHLDREHPHFRYYKARFESLRAYLTRFPVLRTDLRKVEGLAGRRKHIGAAELLAGVWTDFEFRILDIAYQRAQRVDVKRPNPVAARFEDEAIWGLARNLFDRVTEIYNADQIFVGDLLHALMQRSRKQAKRQAVLGLYSETLKWKRDEREGRLDYELEADSWRRDKHREFSLRSPEKRVGRNYFFLPHKKEKRKPRKSGE